MSERRKEVSWVDPGPVLAGAASMSGLDYVRGLADGTVPPPPFAALVALDVGRVAPGEVELALEPDESLLNTLGTVHGGVLGTLLDTACGCACHTLLEAGSTYTTTDLQVRYHRAVRPDGARLLARGEVMSAGRRVVVAEAKVRAADGTLLASATSGLLVTRPR